MEWNVFAGARGQPDRIRVYTSTALSVTLVWGGISAGIICMTVSVSTRRQAQCGTGGVDG